MDQIFKAIGDAIGSIFDNPVIKLGIQLAVIYWIILWLAASYWAFRDMQARTDNPLAPYLAAAFVIVFTPILFPLAVFTYRIIRPQERIGEVYERNLAEEAMLAEIEAIPHCPNCDRRVDAGLDHLPHLPDPPEPRLPELHPARRSRLDAVRLVRPRVRAARPDRGERGVADRQPARPARRCHPVSSSRQRAAPRRGPRPAPDVGSSARTVDRPLLGPGSPARGSRNPRLAEPLQPGASTTRLRADHLHHRGPPRARRCSSSAGWRPSSASGSPR